MDGDTPAGGHPKGRPVKAALAVLAVMIVAAGRLSAGGLRDLDDAWLLPAWAVRGLLAPEAVAADGWSLALAQGRLFGVAELPQVGFELGRHWSRGACRIRWERLGQALYREDVGRIELLVGRRWRLGGAAGADRLALAGGETRTVPAGELRIQGRLARGLFLDVWWSIADAPTWHGRQGLRRWLRLHGVGDGWAWAAVVDRRATGEPVLQGEVLLGMAPTVALGLRLEPWSGAAGFCTAWRLGSLMLRSSHLVHPELGPTHRWSVSLGDRR